jgi:hypothetical protein
LHAVGRPCTSASHPVAGTKQRHERALLDHKDSNGAWVNRFAGNSIHRAAVARRVSRFVPGGTNPPMGAHDRRFLRGTDQDERTSQWPHYATARGQ